MLIITWWNIDSVVKKKVNICICLNSNNFSRLTEILKEQVWMFDTELYKLTEGTTKPWRCTEMVRHWGAGNISVKQI